MKVQVQLSNDPEIRTNAILPWDTDDVIKYKQRYQFTTSVLSVLKVNTDGELINLVAPACTDYDGATIPFGIGKGNMKLLIAALFHDLMCKDKSIINYRRHLASIIFRETLIACHMNKFIAWCMYLWVELFQLFRPWHT